MTDSHSLVISKTFIILPSMLDLSVVSTTLVRIPVTASGFLWVTTLRNVVVTMLSGTIFLSNKKNHRVT